MSEEINLDANNLTITEDAFENFQSATVHNEEDFITLSDIVPPQRSAPDLSQELNEIPYDNEVVLGSPQNSELQVNNQDTGSQLLDISENNLNLNISNEEYHKDKVCLNMENSNTPKQQKNSEYHERQELSSDGLGAENYIFEDGNSIIQDSLLSTTAKHSDTDIGTPSEIAEAANGLRRTKRERIPNTSKYPNTTTSSSNNTIKRRPGRPKKVPVPQTTLEPDSTNNDTILLSETCETSSDVVKKGRRARTKTSLTEDSAPTPMKRGRKPKSVSNDVTNNSCSDENMFVESSKQNIALPSELDSPLPNNDENSLTLSTSKRKKQLKSRKRKSYESTNTSDNVAPCNNNKTVSDDDADDVCLSQIKKGLKETDTIPDSNTDIAISVQNNIDEKASDEVLTETQAILISDDPTVGAPAVTEVLPYNIDSEDISGSASKRSCKMPIMSDFEYNVDKVVKEATADSQSGPEENQCLLVEDTSKRRRTAKKTFVYDEGSDEDPFANVESSEDESPKRRKKGKKYYSDDEYVPVAGDRKKGGGQIRSSSSESEDEFNDDLDLVKQKKKGIGLSLFKRGRKPKSQVSDSDLVVTQPVDCQTIVSVIEPKADDDDIEECLETTMIKIDESTKPPAEAWATSNEFENFIAQKTQGTSLKIKKVSSKEKTETLAPLDIPVIKQNEPKKTTETSTQTSKASTSSTGAQTSAPYDIPMKMNIDLTPGQSEKACEFLTSVVKTTVELGQLMSQKSNDFMKKKINTEHVTDTFKMDYCVRKSFLLFKLAKHNLLQMEEDLAKQYEEFLKENELSACREQPKNITPKPKEDSDSDCEIVEVLPNTNSKVEKEKPKFNPKTVFLNKELSIKIAKKPNVATNPNPGKKKLEIKGRHAVWINKNVMVKKVSPSQSFLAQDSRNKKPPDTYVTEKMVSDFFEDYNRSKALSVCAPFIDNNWTHTPREYACYYFVNELDAANTSKNSNDLSVEPAENSNTTPDENSNLNEICNVVNPKSLFTLCFDAIRKGFEDKNEAQKITCDVTDGIDAKGPVTLFRMCINVLAADQANQCKTQTDFESFEINSSCDLPDNQIKENAADMIKEINDYVQYNTQKISNNVEYDIDHDMPFQYNLQELEGMTMYEAVPPLASICYQQIIKMLYKLETFPEQDNDCCPNEEEFNNLYQNDEENVRNENISHSTNGFKSLFTLCLELIQGLQKVPKISNVHTSLILPWYPGVSEPKSLKSISFEKIKQLIYPNYIEESTDHAALIEIYNENKTMENFTINSVNTLTEEAFQSLPVPMGIRIRKQSHNSSNFSDGYDNDGLDEMDFNAALEEDNGWASQLQMHAFRSCTPTQATENTNTDRTEPSQNDEPHELIRNIKSEPIDYFTEEPLVNTAIVKSEPIQALHELNEMTHIPDNIITKRELVEASITSIDRVSSPLVPSNSSYNVETFEQFVRSNKMIQSMDESNNEIFSQSGLRIRRQHEPDADQDNDMSMSLLVPHTFEPLNLVEAKGSLMESSSDEAGGNQKKNAGKKNNKRKKKQKKDAKAGNKDTSAAKDKIVPENEVAVLTKKMREKIRQEEKKIVSSDSDSENLYMFNSKKDKCKKNMSILSAQSVDSSSLENLYPLSSKKNDSKKDSDQMKPKHPSVDLKQDTKQKDEVQCNNVDSTENDNESMNPDKLGQFSGFTAIDQNEITNYQKLMQYVYDKIIPTDNEQEKTIEGNDSVNLNNTGPVFNPDDPVELLECEPTMPIFDNETNLRPGPKRSKKNKKNLEIVNNKTPFTNRNGWHCYSIDSNETKLYKKALIFLEKLPESFVQTYMEYQDVRNKDLEDQEVDRLINLQSLNRSISANIKDGKTKGRSKGASKETSTGQNSENISGAPSPTYSDNFDELAPSDDEGPAVEDETPPPMPARASENNLAKNLLMDDQDSDSDSAGGNKIKQELKDPEDKAEKSKKTGLKSKTVSNKVESGPLMLTADKMMNKELNLLHAPVLLQEQIQGNSAKETSPKEETKPTKKSLARHSKERVKNEDDSSSEEEKQWVSTKEKLLKRLGKKEDAVADDAKRAKLVNEFIERRNESERKNKRESCLGRKGRMRRKTLERQKQLRFLSNELLNEGDGIVTGKRGPAAGLFKGRRNIRKVIDKKSLARSTVVANMEEFERKRRLNMRQNKLREVLGCEEGVNVLVINDEVCLEYDFEEQRPVVTVHPFFTKVMKAHQYEGVKFMWDACFESLGTIESGHAGGGCILAHCMGLGKTLQVLALLHTVLTHPRANMHRVLVCCPLSTVLNWVDEIHKWIGPVTHDIKVFELSKLRKTYERAYQLEDWYNGGGIFIIGYELFRSLTTLDPEIDEIRPTIINKIRNALLDPGPDIIVCDEGHLLKNDCSVLAVAMSRVVTKRRIVLTGTPMQNNLREYFCMVNFIKPNLLGTYSEYSNRFENPIMNGQHRDSVQEDIKLMKARTHILHKVLEGCLQRQEASVLYPYLPKKHEYTVFIPLTKCQWDLYNHYINNYAKTNKQSVLRDFHTLQKIWSHPQVLHSFQMKARDKKDKIKAEKIEDDLALAEQEADIKPAETEVWWLQYLCEGAMLDSLDSSNKFVAVFRILHECVALGDKILIFSTSLFCLDALEYFLKKINKWSLGQEYYRLDGSVPAEVRQKWCREFNAENNVKTQLFLISTRAGCLGLNMTAANRVIILDTSWNPAHDIQSIFRVYRFGQKKDCYIYRLVALGTMEQKIYERSVTKQAVACRVVDEQQIDRHYNLAELTELYSVDELGLSVAGGVAVGVNDVALLRVARDAAIHAVHEHDSLLRGSGEQGLPEHERAAAWNQFQQEHEHKQMQNELKANKAVVALKRLEMEHLRKQALCSTSEDPGETSVKTEPPTDEPLSEPKTEPGRSKKGKKLKTIKCKIPITPYTPKAGASFSEHDQQNDLVKKITTILIKHNFMQTKSGPKQISELVAKVKKMVATRKPMALGPGYDELSSSIAEVLLQNNVTMPALTDVEEPKPKKQAPQTQEIPTPVPEETDKRKKRKAALAAEMHFDSLDVIELDDDGDEWQKDVAKPVESKPTKKKTKNTPKDIESSIVLSDDDMQVDNAPDISPEDKEVVPLHPSLLTNSNFIKIVAHTYLAGNPMMDEDAATLAAQYSTLKTLKEAESEGKPIVGGAVYDIAVKVLGKSVLKKLQAANPNTISESNVATNQMQSFLTENSASETPAPTPAAKKPKIGPKSRVSKQGQAPNNVPTPTVTIAGTSAGTPSGTPSVTIYKHVSAGFPAQTPREESILPDEDVVISGPSTAPAERKPIILRKVKLERKIVAKAAPVTPVAWGRGPAPQNQAPADATICLDSDEEDPPVPPLRPLTPKAAAPVPVALTGPRARPQPAALPEPRFYTMSSCGRAVPVSGPPLIPLSAGPGGSPAPQPVLLYGSSGASVTLDPVPVSLVGPDSRPIPLAGPSASPAPAKPDIKSRSVSFVGGPSPLTLRFTTHRTKSSQVSAPPAAPARSAPAKTAPQPGDSLKVKNKPTILNHQLWNSSGASATGAPAGPSRSSDPAAVRPPAPGRPPAPEPSLAPARPPAPERPPATARPPAPARSTPAAAAPPPARRASSSSSSSSARSRSSTPDPLAILKDVVHIQAPKQPNVDQANPIPAKPAPTPFAKTKLVNKSYESKAKSSIVTYSKTDRKSSGKPTSETVLSNKKSNIGATTPICVSVDLTDLPERSEASKTSKTYSKTASFRKDLSKTTGKTNVSTTKLVGTSKSIILDVKSKSLKVDSKNTASVLNISKTIASGSTKQKPADKRPTPSTSAPAPKKKKTELMTLKDFDIDDIDDIIELD